MKKKFIAAFLALTLVFSLSISAAAVNGANGGGSQNGSAQNGALSPEERGTKLQARERIMQCLGTMTQNRSQILSLKDNNLQLASQLRIMLQQLKDSGTTLSEEALAELQALKTQLADLRTQLADTKGQIEALMETYRDYKQAGDLESAEAVLIQVMTIQEARIALSTAIGDITQQILDILSAVDTSAA